MLSNKLLQLAEKLNIPIKDNDINETTGLHIITRTIECIDTLQFNAHRHINIETADANVAEKAKHLEDELKISLSIAEESDVLKSRHSKLVRSIKKEKDKIAVLEDFILTQNQKIKLLVEHIEKLVQFLRVESHLKVKTIERSKEIQKVHDNLLLKLEKQGKKLLAQKRVIEQVTEGSKILEDQLRLMDEKFIEMRTKLDVTRSMYTNETKKIKKNFQDLRLKFALANRGKLLDSVRLPRSAPTTGAPTSQEGDLGFHPKNDVIIPRVQHANTGFQSSDRSSQESHILHRLNSRPISASSSVKILTNNNIHGISVKTSLRPLSAASTTTPISNNNYNAPTAFKPSVSPHTHLSSEFGDDEILMDDIHNDNDGEKAAIVDHIVEKINRKKDKKFKKSWTPETLNSLIKSGGI